MRGREMEEDRGGGGAERNETSHSGTDSRLCQSIQKRPAGTLTSKETAFLHSGESARLQGLQTAPQQTASSPPSWPPPGQAVQRPLLRVALYKQASLELG